jgi:hypothetical protein
LSNNTYVENKIDIRRPEVDIIGYYYVVFGGPVLGIASFMYFYFMNKKIMKERKTE